MYKMKEKGKYVLSLEKYNNNPLLISDLFMDQGLLSKDGTPAKIEKDS